MLRSILALLVVLAFAAPSPAAEPFNVDFSVGWQGCYRPMEWTPIEIGITSNLTKPFGGTVTTSAQQDDLTGMTVAHKFVLTPDLPLHLPLVIKLAYAADACEVRILDDRGRTRWRHEYTLWDFSKRSRTITAVGENDLLIGLAGRSVFGLTDLPKHSICVSKPQMDRPKRRTRANQPENGKVYLKQKLPRRLPWDWTGFASLDLLVLYDPDWDLINVHQAKAIVQWVSNGGKLLIVLGTHQLSPAHPIAKALPFELGQVKQITIPPVTLESWKCKATAEATVAHWPLKPRSDSRFCSTSSYNTQETLFATGFVGFGRVGILSFDPASLVSDQPKDRARFWVEQLALLLGDSAEPEIQHRQIEFAEDTDAADSDQDRYPFGYYEAGQDSEAINAVLGYLLDIPELQPLSIWWVVLLLAVLAILLGPVDYLVLKRLGRLPLTWITSACCILLFTIGAYYGVYALRAGATQIRAVSVLDGIEGSDYAWSTVYSGLFASTSDDYRLLNLRKNQWWSATSPREHSYYGYSRDIGSRNIYCSQHDGGNLPYSLPINIWSMQCLLCESPLQKVPITATVQRIGDEVIVSITNHSDQTISRGFVRFDLNQVMQFGSVGGGQTKEFRGKLAQGKDRDWAARRIRMARSPITSRWFTTDNAYFAQGSLQRTRAIQAYLQRGAAVVCAEYDEAPVSFGLAEHKYKDTHIQLVRLVVFPKKG